MWHDEVGWRRESVIGGSVETGRTGDPCAMSSPLKGVPGGSEASVLLISR